MKPASAGFFFSGAVMDRQIIYPGAIPLETDLLNTNRNAMIGLSKLAAAILGTSAFLNGLANYGATSGGPGGYGVAARLEYASLSMIQGAVTDADIYAAVDSVKPAGTILWARITS
jgi:hypothetical protein